MKIFYIFAGLVFAIYVAVRGVGFIQQGSNSMILIGIGCMFLALAVSYIAVKLALKNK
ncbi:hypothetical protein [Pedobacter sp. UBA4863]|uniref:hypothetical protein n=1 Tax=Pedobacter sp. UBA4863 TaxID=1947060 RepID=UPI0025F55D14|nr:hypothetical protein [Pedobacter sp. UBA4863]